jgi:hypothetical protein
VYKAYDDNNNVGTCSYKVTVVDTATLTLQCPYEFFGYNYTVNSEGGKCGASVNLYNPTESPRFYDKACVLLERTSGLESGVLFPIGQTQQAYKITANGKTATCSYKY